MRYLEVTVRCARLTAEAVSCLLTDLAGGVAVTDPLDVVHGRQAGRWDLDDLPPADPDWVTVSAYLADSAQLRHQLAALAAKLADVRSWAGDAAVAQPTERWVDAQDWENAWKAYFRPLPIGRRLLVLPAWEAADWRLLPDEPVRLPVILDPGMAFGTGSHPTTTLCLEWLEDLVAAGQPVLDVGCGSGILAIAAARLGACPVLGCDPDPVAVTAATANVAANGLTDQVAIAAGELDAGPVQSWLRRQPPAVVVANLVAHLLISLAPALAAALPPGGRLLVSGVVVEREAAVAAALAATGLAPAGTRADSGWVAMLAEKR